jgi:hypothetical protein
MSVEITLSETEMQIAAFVRCKRGIQNLIVGRKDRNGARREECWQYHVDGAFGEIVVAQWRNNYWCGNLGDLDADDVDDKQVRMTIRHDGRLIIHDYDNDDKPYILVTGPGPKFVVRGWIYGREGKQKEYWCDPTGKGRFAYFVPQSALRPVKSSESVTA